VGGVFGTHRARERGEFRRLHPPYALLVISSPGRCRAFLFQRVSCPRLENRELIDLLQKTIQLSLLVCGESFLLLASEQIIGPSLGGGCEQAVGQNASSSGLSPNNRSESPPAGQRLAKSRLEARI